MDPAQRRLVLVGRHLDGGPPGSRRTTPSRSGTIQTRASLRRHTHQVGRLCRLESPPCFSTPNFGLTTCLRACLTALRLPQTPSVTLTSAASAKTSRTCHRQTKRLLFINRFLVPATLSLNRSKNCTVIALRGVRQGPNCIGLNHPCELPNRTSSWSLQVWLVVLVASDLLADLVCAIFFWWFQLMNKHMSQWVQSL